MPSIRVKIINKRGLHARAAAKFATTAAQFPCKIQARRLDNETWVDGKSVMSLMLLASAMGSELEIDAEGESAQEALDALNHLIADYFEEGE